MLQNLINSVSTLVRAVDQLIVRGLLGLIHGYQRLLSPWLGRQCRFHPTCSCYAAEALSQHGSIKGTCLTIWRLLRCQPFAASGFDPVPPQSTTIRESNQHATH